MIEQICLSPQVKRSVIISNKVVYTSYLTSWQLKKSKEQSCKLRNNKYMIASTQITNTEILASIAASAPELLHPQPQIPYKHTKQ